MKPRILAGLLICALALAGGLGGTGPAIAQAAPPPTSVSGTLTAACSADPCAAGTTLTASLPGPNSSCTFNITGNSGGNTLTFEQTNASPAGGPWGTFGVLPNNASTTVTTTSGTTFYGAQIVIAGTAIRVRLSTFVSGSAAVQILCGQVAVSAYAKLLSSSGTSNAGAGFFAAVKLLGFTHAYTGASPGPSPAPCQSSQPVTDQIGGNNLTGINSTQMMCGAQPVIKDGTSTSFILCSNGSSTLSCGLNTSNYFDVPSAALPVSTNLTECSAYAMDTIFDVNTTLFSYDNADRIIYYPEGGTWARTDIRSGGLQSSPFGPDTAPHFDCVVSNGTNVIVYHDGIMVSITANNPSGGPGGDGGWGAQIVGGAQLNFQGRAQWLLIGPAMSQTQMAWLFSKTGL